MTEIAPTAAYTAVIEQIISQVEEARPIGSLADHLAGFAGVLKTQQTASPAFAAQIAASASVLEMVVVPLLRATAARVGEGVNS